MYLPAGITLQVEPFQKAEEESKPEGHVALATCKSVNKLTNKAPTFVLVFDRV